MWSSSLRKTPFGSTWLESRWHVYNTNLQICRMFSLKICSVAPKNISSFVTQLPCLFLVSCHSCYFHLNRRLKQLVCLIRCTLNVLHGSFPIRYWIAAAFEVIGKQFGPNKIIVFKREGRKEGRIISLPNRKSFANPLFL